MPSEHPTIGIFRGSAVLVFGGGGVKHAALLLKLYPWVKMWLPLRRVCIPSIHILSAGKERKRKRGMCKVTLEPVYCLSRHDLKNGRDFSSYFFFRRRMTTEEKKFWPEYNETVTIATTPPLMRRLSDGRSTFVIDSGMTTWEWIPLIPVFNRTNEWNNMNLCEAAWSQLRRWRGGGGGHHGITVTV